MNISRVSSFTNRHANFIGRAEDEVGMRFEELTIMVKHFAHTTAKAEARAVSNRSIKLYYSWHDSPRARIVENGKRLTVVYVPGYMSLGRSTKSTFIARYCASRGFDYVCYDPEGVVDISSSSQDVIKSNYESIRFKYWFDDCYTALETVKERNLPRSAPVLLVGSSMGAWISIQMALSHPKRISGLLLLAPSVNSTSRWYQSNYKNLKVDARKKLDAGETVILPSPYGHMPFSRSFVEHSKYLDIDLRKGIDARCPVRIVHGARDGVVPLQQVIDLTMNLNSPDVDLVIKKEGEHRLCAPKDLEIIAESLDKLTKLYQQPVR